MVYVPTITLNELTSALDDPQLNESAKTVLGSILDDFMDLQYGKETNYTTGKQVLPLEATEEDLIKAVEQTADAKFNEIFVKILETHRSGDLTPQSKSDGTWDPKLTPVLVVVTPNNMN